MKNITAIILAKNEEANLKRALEKLLWCDEIILVDDNSTDKTIRIAEDLGVKVYSRSLDNFSSQRNFGLSKVSSEWAIFVDADELLSDALIFEISNIISNWVSGKEREYAGYKIPRIDVMWSRELRHGDSGVKLLRLAKKDAGGWVGFVHERWNVDGNVGMLINPIIHYPHQSITEFLREINFYTTLRAKELYLKNVKTNIISIFMYPFGKFILNYFLKRGFLDGIPGLTHAIVMSFHSFLVRSKLWAMYGENN